MIEISLLKALAIKDNLLKYKPMLNPKTLASQSIIILKAYEEYFKLNTEHLCVDLGLFKTLFFNSLHPYISEKEVLEYSQILSLLAEQHNKDEIQKIIAGFEQQEFYSELHNLLDQNIDVITIQTKLDIFKAKIQDITRDDQTTVDMDLIQALDYTDRSTGLRWRCKALEEHFQGGLIQGDFGIIAGYVDAGKTSFLISEVSHMATQLKDDDYILWFSNEGSWKSILPRVYCATLNCRPSQLVKHKDRAVTSYTTKMNGDKNRIRIVDIQGWSAKDCENIVIKKTPALVVIDLVDNLSGFDKYMNKESSFEKYCKLYQWCRELATQYCPVLGVSQMNREGENKMYPSMSSLRGSGVDKQAAATFQLMIGSLEGDNTTRYLSMPKNKINENKGWKAIVKFDPIKSIYL